MSLNVEEHAVFKSFKRAICSGPQLAHPDISKQFVVHTDALKYAVGGVLLQRSDDGIESTISFFSNKLLPHTAELLDV